MTKSVKMLITQRLYINGMRFLLPSDDRVRSLGNGQYICKQAIPDPNFGDYGSKWGGTMVKTDERDESSGEYFYAFPYPRQLIFYPPFLLENVSYKSTIRVEVRDVTEDFQDD